MGSGGIGANAGAGQRMRNGTQMAEERAGEAAGAGPSDRGEQARSVPERAPPCVPSDESAERLERLDRQLAFVLELDRLKRVERRSWLLDGSRFENSAEHSWHVALMALVLAEHAREPLDLARVVKMLLVHDVVEIDAGDTYIYGAGTAGQDEREAAAADRLFGLLPDGQGETLRALWEEYEAQSSPEARFAKSIDRLMPFLHNVHTEGRSWREHGVCAADVTTVIAQIAPGSEALHALARRLLRAAVDAGHLPAERAAGQPGRPSRPGRSEAQEIATTQEANP